MRTIETTVYTFAELSEQGKQQAINNLSSINIDFDWWQYTYLDAKNVGININNFDLDRTIDIGMYDCLETANKIIQQHGPTCDTHKNAIQFIAERDALVSRYSDGGNKVPEENENDFDCELDELESEYKKSLEEDYLSLLRNEYEYLSSREAIIETIEANDYEFTEDGKLI
jgi:hypothetical protein